MRNNNRSFIRSIINKGHEEADYFIRQYLDNPIHLQGTLDAIAKAGWSYPDPMVIDVDTPFVRAYNYLWQIWEEDLLHLRSSR